MIGTLGASTNVCVERVAQVRKQQGILVPNKFSRVTMF